MPEKSEKLNFRKPSKAVATLAAAAAMSGFFVNKGSAAANKIDSGTKTELTQNKKQPLPGQEDYFRRSKLSAKDQQNYKDLYKDTRADLELVQKSNERYMGSIIIEPLNDKVKIPIHTSTRDKDPLQSITGSNIGGYPLAFEDPVILRRNGHVWLLAFDAAAFDNSPAYDQHIDRHAPSASLDTPYVEANRFIDYTYMQQMEKEGKIKITIFGPMNFEPVIIKGTTKNIDGKDHFWIKGSEDYNPLNEFVALGLGNDHQDIADAARDYVPGKATGTSNPLIFKYSSYGFGPSRTGKYPPVK